MEESVLHFTLRELKRQATSLSFWLGMLCVIAILAVSGPFLTAERFDLPQRFAYWGAIAVTTYFLAIACVLFFSRLLTLRGFHELVALTVSSVIAGLAVALLVYYINVGIIQIDKNNFDNFLELAASTIPIAMAITAIFYILEKNMSPPAAVQLEKTDPFLSRLPKSLGTDLISLQAQDHYVEATTHKGKELVLLRLSDAISELSAETGIQTHRSWWVAKKHVHEQVKKNGKPFLKLSNGVEVPISRTFAAAVKEHLNQKI